MEKQSGVKKMSKKNVKYDGLKGVDIMESTRYEFVSGGRGAGRSINRKIKVTEAEIVVHGTSEKPYFEIRYKKVGKDDYNLGFASYNLDFVFQWLEEEFEIVKEKEENKRVNHSMEEEIEFKCDFCLKRCPDLSSCDHRYDASKCKILYEVLEKDGFIKKSIQEEKVVQYPVDMDEMQKNILIGLINARKECTDENILTARGCAAMIDALFYLVKER